MTLAQATALRQLPHFSVVGTSTPDTALLVRGACGLYWLSPVGLLTPIDFGRLLLDQRNQSGTTPVPPTTKGA